MHQPGVVRSENARPPVVNNAGAEDAKWFVAYTNSRHEKCVAKHLAERTIESYLPLYQRVHHWMKRRTVRLDLPLFPNYVFVHIAPQYRSAVLAVPGVLGMLGRGHNLSALADHEIQSLRVGLEQGRVEPHPYLVAGERVRIRTGSMEGMEGILIRKKNELRVVLSLDLIRRSVAVEVDAGDIEPVRSRPWQASPSG